MAVPTTLPPDATAPPPPGALHKPLPRCAVVNFSREGDSVRWAPRLASSHDRACGGLLVRGRPGALGVMNGNDRMRALLEDPFRLEELSSRALKFMKKCNKKTWGNGFGDAATERGKRSPTKISETACESEEEKEVETVKEDAKESPKKKGDYSYLRAVSPRKSSMLKKPKPSVEKGEEPSLFARMFAKAKRKSGAKRDDVFDNDELKELKARLRRPSRTGTTRSSTASKDKRRRASKATQKQQVISSKEKAMILHPTASRPRRRWFLRSFRTPKDKQLIVYQNSYRGGDQGHKHGFKLRRLPRMFKKRRPRFADQQKGAAEHNISRRLIPNVSMYDDDFVAFMTSAAVKKSTQV